MRDGWMRRPTIAVCVLLAWQASVRGADGDFDTTVAPLLSERCLDCHTGDKPKGGLDLSRRQTTLAGGDEGEVIVPGAPDKSRLWEYVRDDKMPPKKPLSAAEKVILKAWIASGAKWGSDPIDPFRATTAKRAGYDWWSLKPIEKTKPPTVQDTRWSRNPIDAFVLQRLEARKLHPSTEANRRTLIRRLSFDLLGLPPTPEEVAAFEKDESPTAYEKLVDRYLQSPQYGERWARHWLDVVRFGESNGFEFDELRPNAWPYRDWVVQALNRDLPYDEFVRLQLAGDVLRPNDPEAIAATGFLVAGAYDTVGQTQQSEAMKKVVRQDELEDLVGVVGQTFLGLTINCARCHDHKFDPIRQTEYYRLTAALAGVRHGERTWPKGERDLARARQRLDELEKKRASLEMPIREQLRSEGNSKVPVAPKPLAQWEFTSGLRDALANLDGTIRGDARLGADGLKVDGKTGYVFTQPLKADLKAKTLEAWVSLANLKQRGGGVMSVQTIGGGAFDAIVFGEIDEGQWMAGSENFVRTRSFRGPVETEADRRVVHLAVVWSEDGTIAAYRDGKPYGTPYQSGGVRTFKAGEAEILFGLRHAPSGGNRLLAGVIHRANLYERALSPVEVAASAGVTIIPIEAVVARLSPEQRSLHKRLSTEIDSLRELLTQPPPRVHAVVPRPPETTYVLARGNPAQRGEVVSAGGIRSLAGIHADFGLSENAPEGERRKRLAEWITHPKNPLFARVIVNRLWHHHFGVGLIDTPNDFGFNGGRPSHPQLLDWLASELMANGWSLKQLHRLMVTSATYRQASTWNEAASRIDADNRLLWRKSLRRLEAETIRDAALQITGKLNLRMGGPGFQDLRLVRAPGTAAMIYVPVESLGDEFRRRTLYRVWTRGGRNQLLDAFDCPDPSTTTPKRTVTTTPLQALAMLNNSFVLKLAEEFAQRLEREAGGDVDQRIRRAYLLAFGRPVREDELKIARRIVREHGTAVLTRAIFNSNEFLYVD
jgi:hypothetical protein